MLLHLHFIEAIGHVIDVIGRRGPGSGEVDSRELFHRQGRRPVAAVLMRILGVLLEAIDFLASCIAVVVTAVYLQCAVYVWNEFHVPRR